MGSVIRRHASTLLLTLVFFELHASVFAQPSRVVPKIKVIALTSPVNRGSTASMTIQTTPKATCWVVIHQKFDPGTKQDLVHKAADANGLVKWTWKVGGLTNPGSKPITVTCSGSSHQSTLVTSFRVR